MRLLAFAFLLATSTLVFAQAAGEPIPKIGNAIDQSFAKLRGVSFFYIDVKTSETRPEDADLRGEIRDAIELELRRSNITPKDFNGLSPETSTPLLTIEVRFDRGLGRYAADVILTISDNATVTRNKESVLATTYTQTKKSMGSSDNTLSREVKNRSREAVLELIDGIKKLKGN